MSQNLAKTHFEAAQWEAVDEAIAGLERALGTVLLALAPGERRRLVKMGDASESFCRKAYDAMREHGMLLPANLDVEEMGRDLATHDALSVRLSRLDRVMEKANDTDLALGSDVMVAALEGYAFLKLAGKAEGLQGLRRELGKRFENNGPRRTAPSPA